MNRGFQTLAPIDHAKALHHMELLGMRRAEGIEDAPGVRSDGVDDQRVALVMADRLAEPRGLDVRRVGHIQIDDFDTPG